jgi:hypothetical protein
MILVTGLEYSGTSLAAGLLHHLGVDMGQIETPAQLWAHRATWESLGCEGEPRGYLSYECQDFLQHALPYLRDATPANHYNGECLGELLSHYALTRHGLWGLKSTQLCFLAWWSGLERFPARWVLTQRPLEEVSLSGARYTGVRTPWALWAAQGLGVQRLAWLRLVRLLGERATVVPFVCVRLHPEPTIHRLIEALDLNPTPEQVAAAVNFVRKD